MKTMPSESMYQQYQSAGHCSGNDSGDVSVSAVTGSRRMRSNSNIADTISNTFLKKFWTTKEKKADKRVAAIEYEETSSSASPSPTLFRRSRRASSVIQNNSTSMLAVKSVHSRSRSPSPSFLRGLGRRSSATNDKNQENLLHYHVSHQDCHALDKLLSDPTHEVDINYMRPPGVSALHQACSQGSIKIVRLLVSYGADIQQKTWSQLSPLKVAVLSGSYEVAQYLVEVGANSDDIKNGCQFETSSSGSPSTKSKSKRNNSF